MIYFLKPGQVIVLVCVLGCLSACGLTYRERIKPEPSSFQQELSGLFERRVAFQDMRGRAAISISRRGKKQSFLANVIFDSSYRLRMEGLGLFNIPFFFLVADGKRILFYFPEEQRVLQGESSQKNLYRMTGIRAGVEDLIALFSGNLPPDLSSPSKLNIKPVDLHQGLIELRSEQKEVYRLWIIHGLIAKMEIYGADGDLQVKARFDNYEAIDDYQWPRWIECNDVASETQLTIKYKKIFLNSGIARGAFFLDYPPTLSPDDLDGMPYQ
jgi:hypothetical protein